MDDIWWQDDEEFIKGGVSPDRDHEPMRITETGNATRAEGRQNDIARYKEQIKKCKRKKQTLMRFKDESKIGEALGKLNKKIRFFRDMIARTRRVGSYDYPPIYDDVRELIVSMEYNNAELADKAGVSKASIHNLRSRRFREVSKSRAHNVYEVLLGIKRREA